MRDTEDMTFKIHKLIRGNTIMKSLNFLSFNLSNIISFAEEKDVQKYKRKKASWTRCSNWKNWWMTMPGKPWLII